jgi:hypothetical protein
MNGKRMNFCGRLSPDLSADPQLTWRPRPFFRPFDKVYRNVYDDLTTPNRMVDLLVLDGTRPDASTTRKERANSLNICQRTYQTIQQ